MSYCDLWNVLWSWRKEFTVKEFSSFFVSPDPNKVLHDMVKKGFLERSGWGKYRVNSPEEYLARRVNISKSYDLLKESDMDYALTGPDGVFLWTKGGYQVGRFFGFYPIHLKVGKKDLEKWKSFFGSRKQRFQIMGQPVRETLFSLFYVLYPEVEFDAEEINGLRVIPLKEAVDFCQRNIYSYEPALEMLDEMYGLGLKVMYKEAKTNF